MTLSVALAMTLAMATAIAAVAVLLLQYSTQCLAVSKVVPACLTLSVLHISGVAKAMVPAKLTSLRP